MPLLARRVFQRRRTTILMYHAPSPAVLHRHLSKIVRLYNVVSLRDFVAAHQKLSPQLLPPHPLVITLDDGHRSNIDLLHVLSKWKVPVTIFASQSHMKPFDSPRLSCEQIDELLPVADIQSHTVNHVNLPESTADVARKEIVEDREHLQQHHAIAVYAFAYPDGAYSERDIALLRESGYTCALTTEPGSNSASSDLFRLKRIGIPDDADVDELVVKASGIWAVLRGAVTGPIRGHTGAHS
jgi:peptidoglycan/xylan/chitin deacetylase (PgdA/CDA1 family)